MSLLANGLNPTGWTRSDAWDVVNMLVRLQRAVPADKWVADLEDRALAGVIED